MELKTEMECSNFQSAELEIGIMLSSNKSILIGVFLELHNIEILMSRQINNIRVGLIDQANRQIKKPKILIIMVQSLTA